MDIFYSPYTQNAFGIADRRRILHWAKARGHTIRLVSSNKDVPPDATIIISSNSDFRIWSHFRKSNPKSRVYLDVVDGIQGEESELKDFLRGFSLVLTGRISGIPKSMKRILAESVVCFDGIICSSVEQKNVWRHFFDGPIYSILDFHEEIPNLIGLPKHQFQNNEFFWEGLPYTLEHFSCLVDFFRQIEIENPTVNVHTSLDSYRYMGRFLKLDPIKILDKSGVNKKANFKVSRWSIETIRASALTSNFGIIPMTIGRGYNYLKAENRLLIMWRLGLPTLVSPLQSYLRVEKELGMSFVCRTPIEWVENFKLLTFDLEYRNSFLNSIQEYLRSYHTEELLLTKWDRALALQ